MSGKSYTVEQAAERLKLHPKTVLRMIREGRLKAVRLGKAYRIAGDDLDAAAGVARAEVRESPDRATVIADFGEIGPDLAQRLGSTLTAMLGSNSARAVPISLQTAYDPMLRRLKVVVIGAPEDAAALLKSAVFLLEFLAMSPSIFKSEGDAQAVHALYRQVLDGWTEPKTELRVATREGETFVVAAGKQDAPPLVLLHGAQANASVWMFDMAMWSRAFRCYAVDMIGEAGFSPPARPPLDSEAHALWLDDVMAGLGLAKAAFVGVSLGGWLALDYAKRRPAAVERMALVCPGGIGRQKDFRWRAAPLMLLGTWGQARMREMVLGPSRGEPPPAARPFVELMGLIGRTIHPRGVRLPRLSDAELERLTMPVLVIVGGKDVLLDSADTRRRLAKWTPHAEMVFLPQARHFIPGHASRILAFLQGGRT